MAIDLNKSLEFFDPSTVDKRVNLVGCGAVGSQLAVLLARLGITKFGLWDEDTVATHNIANQNFKFNDVGRLKTECVAETILSINPEADIIVHGFATESDFPRGIVVYCVDSIAVRKMITTSLMCYPGSHHIFDFRMGLTSGQFYSVEMTKVGDYLNTMNFTDEEADAQTPRSACNFELSVAYSIWAMLGVGVSQMVRYWKGESVNMTTLIDCGNLSIMAI